MKLQNYRDRCSSSSAVPSMPHNLAKALNEAWQEGMWNIHKDAHHELHQELNSAHCAYDACQNSVLKGKNTFQEVWKECRQVSGFGVVSSEK